MFLKLDSIIETIAVYMLVVMTLIVSLQVATRKIFNVVFFWSEEVTILLLIWFSFLGIAIGFREKIHIAMSAFTALFPKFWNKVLDKIISATVFSLGLYFIVYGWRFSVAMHANTLSATGWPVSVMYVIMPITGILICIYSALEFFGIDTVRHRYLDEEVVER
ncbi:TRAP transporter small permease [Bacillus sinesaloumensis]|uniref:TRAP transporter small permease n=1 Tax=Litchfieldia sinesaloumensis TaxID=1926280 RepID=UPI001F365B3D|nr:TRAP transporter small permease [Bacillus sinesaloumensis]